MNKFKKFIIVVVMFIIGVSSITLFACSKKQEPELTLIAPFKTSYFIGEELDVSNGKIKYTDKKVRETILDIESSMISNFSTETRGNRTMILTYNDLTIDIDYSVSLAPQLTLIAPFKTSYLIGEELDVSNGKIKYTNKDAVETILDVESSMISNFSTETRGKRTMTLTYNDLSMDIDYSVSPEPILLPNTWANSLSDDTYWLESIIFDYNAPEGYQKITSIGEGGGIEIWKKENKYALISDYKITLNSHFSFSFFQKIEEIVFNNFDYVNTDASFIFNCENLKSITFPENFGANITNMEGMFNVCKSLVSLDLSGFDTSNVTNMNMMFNECEALTSIVFPKTFAPKVTNMQKMFKFCENLNTLDLTGFDTSNVIDMSEMFYQCRSLTKIDFPKTFGAKAENMKELFSQCYLLTSLDLSGFKTSSVTNMSSMFSNCYDLTSINFADFNTSSVTDMSFMFNGCSISALDLSSFDTSNVIDMSFMFNYCLKMEKIYVGEKWNTQNANIENMFLNCGCEEVTKK